MEIKVRYRTLLGYTVLVLGTNKFKNNINQINSRILIKAFFHLMHKNEYHHCPISKELNFSKLVHLYQ